MNFEEVLEKIFREYGMVEFQGNSLLKEKELFGYDINLKPIYLVLILIQIEEIFDIKISSEIITNKEFSTFNKILHIIEQLK